MARLNHVKSFRGTTKTDDGNLRCERCQKPIKPGDGYRWWANKMRHMRGSVRRIRCMDSTCTPRPSEMKPGRTGQIMRIGEDFEEAMNVNETWTEASDFTSLAESTAEQMREIGQELADGADNLEEGFGHETSQSAELRERAERINSAADELEQVDIPEPDDHECEHCDGGTVEWDEGDEAECLDCGATVTIRDSDGVYTCEKCGHDAAIEPRACEECGATGRDLNAWREAAITALEDAWSEAEGEMY